MTQPIEFSNQKDAGNGVFAVSQTFHDIKEAAHEHLLTRIEELGAEFGRWSRTAIQRFVDLEVEGFTRMRRIPVNETEVRQIAEALTKELAGFGPLWLRREELRRRWGRLLLAALEIGRAHV